MIKIESPYIDIPTTNVCLTNTKMYVSYALIKKIGIFKLNGELIKFVDCNIDHKEKYNISNITGNEKMFFVTDHKLGFVDIFSSNNYKYLRTIKYESKVSDCRKIFVDDQKLYIPNNKVCVYSVKNGRYEREIGIDYDDIQTGIINMCIDNTNLYILYCKWEKESKLSHTKNDEYKICIFTKSNGELIKEIDIDIKNPGSNSFVVMGNNLFLSYKNGLKVINIDTGKTKDYNCECSKSYCEFGYYNEFCVSNNKLFSYNLFEDHIIETNLFIDKN